MRNRTAALLSGFSVSVLLAAGPPAPRRPLVGAEIMLSQDVKLKDIDYWFKTLAAHQMPLARIFIPPDSNLSRADAAFRAAEKYGVKIAATLTAIAGSPLSERSVPIIVERHKGSPALDSWILKNEPGQAPAGDPIAVQRYRVWLRAKYRTIDNLNAAWRSQYGDFEKIEYDPSWTRRGWGPPAVFLDWWRFWRSHLTWHLSWVAERVRKVDPVHPTHANPHGLINNLANYSQDLPAWRPALDTLGCSIHPSWHFRLVRRDQVAMGVSYTCDLVRGAAEPHPFWVTELQGGSNTFSGNRPLNPFKEDIAQWLWTSIGSGADRVIFWLLNNRYQGTESGEWSMLDFQNRPTERLRTAGEIAKIVNSNADLFQNARPLESPIVLLLSLETMDLQEYYKQADFPGRGSTAHVLSVLAYYEALQQLGLPVEIKHMHDFDWRRKAGKPRLAILPHVMALSNEQAKGIETFVKNGNTVLMTGLTGFYDPEANFLPLRKFPLEDLIGATVKDNRLIDEKFEVSLSSPKITLPSHLWLGEIENHSAEPIGSENGWITAVRKRAGEGQVIWIPSLIGLGAWLGDNKPLAAFLTAVAEPFSKDLPVRFDGQQPGCTMRVMRSGGAYIAVITNGEKQPKTCRLQPPPGYTARALWGEGISGDGRRVSLGPRATVVAVWNR